MTERESGKTGTEKVGFEMFPERGDRGTISYLIGERVL